jgi:CBS domain-containing protein
MQLKDIMTPEVEVISPEATIQEAACLMEQYQIRRLPILNRDKRLVGIAALGDLAVRTANPALAGEVLEHVSEPAKPQR